MARSLSKKVRFDVFKRDSFSCQYCGLTPPRVVLEVDHIIPVSAGGLTHLDNLVTACFDCNRGKGAGRLDAVPLSVAEKLILAKEREAQLRELHRFHQKVEQRLQDEMTELNNLFWDEFDGCCMTETFMNSSLRMFLDKLPFFEVMDSMRKSCSRMPDPDRALKYFCGICWNKIKGEING